MTNVNQYEALPVEALNEAQRAEFDARQSAWEAGRAEREQKMVKQQREQRYRKEADPLYFQVQRGEATQQEYDDLIAQIRADLPYAQEAGGS